MTSYYLALSAEALGEISASASFRDSAHRLQLIIKFLHSAKQASYSSARSSITRTAQTTLHYLISRDDKGAEHRLREEAGHTSAGVRNAIHGASGGKKIGTT
jgi:hypothetical protein